MLEEIGLEEHLARFTAHVLPELVKQIDFEINVYRLIDIITV